MLLTSIFICYNKRKQKADRQKMIDQTKGGKVKRIFVFISALILVVGIFGSARAFTLIEYNLDQSQILQNNWNKIKGHTYCGQSFKPTVNKINQVSLFLYGAPNDHMTIQITKSGSANPLLPDPFQVGDGTARWYYWQFDPLTVTPGDTYLVWISALNNESKWYLSTSSGDKYPDGQAYIDNPGILDTNPYPVGFQADWTFKIYGTKDQAPSAPATDPNTNGTSDQQATTEKPSATAAAIDEKIDIPELTKVEKDGKTVVIASSNTLAVYKGEKLELFGTALAGQKVNVFVADKKYTADVDTKGKWTVELKDLDLKTKTNYSIQAQTVKGDKGSEKTEFFKVRYLGEKEAIVASDKTFIGENLYWLLGVLGTLIIILAGVSTFLYMKKRKGMKSINDEGTTGDEKPTE